MSKVADLIRENIKNSPEFKQYYKQAEQDIMAQETSYGLNPHFKLDLSDFDDILGLDELRSLFQ